MKWGRKIKTVFKKKKCLQEFQTAGTGRISDGGLNGEVGHVNDCAREEFRINFEEVCSEDYTLRVGLCKHDTMK